MVLVFVALDVVDGDPLLVLNKADRKARVDRGLDRAAAVAQVPGPAKVVAVDDADVGVRMEVGPEGVERQRDLIHAAQAVKAGIRIRVVGPARRHVLAAGGDAVVTRDHAAAFVGAVRKCVPAQVEVVEGAVFLKEDLRSPHQVLGAWIDGDPRFRPVGVVGAHAARSRGWRGCARRNRIPTAQDHLIGDLVGEGNARAPGARGRSRCWPQHDGQRSSGQGRPQAHVHSPHLRAYGAKNTLGRSAHYRESRLSP